MTVVHLAQYAAPYLGNFVKSLMHLEERLKKDGGNMVYVFPPQAGDCAWFEDFASKHEVGLILPGAAGVAAIEAIIKGDFIRNYPEQSGVSSIKEKTGVIMVQSKLPTNIMFNCNPTSLT